MAIALSGGEHLQASQAAVAAAPLTLSCWFKCDALQSASLVTISDATASNSYFDLGVLASGEVYAVARDGAAWNGVLTTANYALGQWHHATAVFSSSNQRTVWLDGGASNSGTTTHSPAGLTTTSFGKLVRSSATSSFVGRIAEVGIWSQALSEPEVNQLSQGFSPLANAMQRDSLVLYQDLIRDPNHPGVGPSLATLGTIQNAPHPRVLYAQAVSVVSEARPLWPRLAASQAAVVGATQAELFVPGAENGATYPFAEAIA